MIREQAIAKIAGIITDYRKGEIRPIDEAHVNRWVNQFSTGVQDAILNELAHVLDNSYITKKNVEYFLKAIISNKNITGDDICAYWRGVKFLSLQTAGHSQKIMLEIFDEKLRQQCGIGISQCGTDPHSYIYIDDVLFSGNRIRSDIIGWIKSTAPSNTNLLVVTIAFHKLGQYFSQNSINDALREAGKSINITWWRCIEIEDRKRYMDNSDVLRPTAVPNDPATEAYVKSLGADPIFRTPGNVGERGFFSSDSAKILLEQEFLKEGVRVRGMCPYLNIYMRPLGASLMKTTGFGSTIVTYRNCPNNTPLVLWAGDPWYPLFPRKTN